MDSRRSRKIRKKTLVSLKDRLIGFFLRIDSNKDDLLDKTTDKHGCSENEKNRRKIHSAFYKIARYLLEMHPKELMELSWVFKEHLRTLNIYLKPSQFQEFESWEETSEYILDKSGVVVRQFTDQFNYLHLFLEMNRCVQDIFVKYNQECLTL
jgi:hypothetical protein